MRSGKGCKKLAREREIQTEKNAEGEEGKIELQNVQVGSQARTVSKKFPRKDRPAETRGRQKTKATRIPRAEAVGCKGARMNGAS